MRVLILIIILFLGAEQEMRLKELRGKEIKVMERYERVYKNSFRECGVSF